MMTRTMMPMGIVVISEFEVTDPGIYAEPTTTKNSEPPVTVIEDVVQTHS